MSNSIPKPTQGFSASPASAQQKYQLYPPNFWYRTVLQGLIVPELPPPLHYFNFRAVMGLDYLPIVQYPAPHSASAKECAVVMSSISAHMNGHFRQYNLAEHCYFNTAHYNYADHSALLGQFPSFVLHRWDDELSVTLNIHTQTSQYTCYSRFWFDLFEFWSMPCWVEGSLYYKQQHYSIAHWGSFEYARSLHMPYVQPAFYCYQLIQLDQQRQLICIQLRNRLNQVLLSKIFLRHIVAAFGQAQEQLVFQKAVQLYIHRVYPKVATPNGQWMYLAREFEWQATDSNYHIRVVGQSRGDYKFGAAAGYAGSFQYQVQLNDEYFSGEAAYCEYIDCRALNWQEQDQEQRSPAKITATEALIYKNNAKNKFFT
ncbi:hypothetical protein [Acinetobacter larvae]|uniref:Uncharacterized protein n=1 Tax=Acinetobacter larvae TaxID=1789224 RepID=A0A1B2M2F9_9GAMM|nr:hypothetical protein [Acinetobacter larvae]AOA59385.1 hypothetical protein BFG52_14190 [Acinetobacter larvae]